jgi:hypothetical protein
MSESERYHKSAKQLGWDSYGLAGASWTTAPSMIQLLRYGIKTWIAQVDAAAAGGDYIAIRVGFSVNAFPGFLPP